MRGGWMGAQLVGSTGGFPSTIGSTAPFETGVIRERARVDPLFSGSHARKSSVKRPIRLVFGATKKKGK
jgi:hypothetical protein